MELTFDGGTAQAIAYVQSAVASSSYPWDRLPQRITVSWQADPYPGIHNEFAVTLFEDNVWTDRLGRPMAARIVMREGLEDAAKAQPGGFQGGAELVRDVFHHELGHVLASMFVNGYTRNGVAHEPHVLQAVHAFGGQLGDWHEPADWADRIEEAWAESFKDTFLARELRYGDNRTHWRLSGAGYSQFLDVIDDLCPSMGGGAT